MSDRETSPSYGRVALQIAGITGGFVIALALGRYAFVESLKPPAAAQAPAPAPASQVTAGGFTLTSASIALPDDAAPYPAGPSADLMNGNCTACHSASMALTQPALSKAQWTSTVEKMRVIYKATIADKDVPAIVDYLVGVSANLGKQAAPGPSRASDASGATG